MLAFLGLYDRAFRFVVGVRLRENLAKAVAFMELLCIYGPGE